MLFGIYGAGGFGREIAPFVKLDPITMREVRLITDKTFGRFVSDGGTEIVIAIADSRARERLTVKCLAAGLFPTTVISPYAVRYDNVEIGRGSIICSFAHLTSDIRIGKSFHANIYSYVAHDCVIGDYVTFAPKVACNGNVTIGDHAYIGTGAVLKPGITIGEGAIIGMGAVVTKNVPAGETWVGNPAQRLKPALAPV